MSEIGMDIHAQNQSLSLTDKLKAAWKNRFDTTVTELPEEEDRPLSRREKVSVAIAGLGIAGAAVGVAISVSHGNGVSLPELLGGLVHSTGDTTADLVSHHFASLDSPLDIALNVGGPITIGSFALNRLFRGFDATDRES
jgi:hypothetical protein